MDAQSVPTVLPIAPTVVDVAESIAVNTEDFFSPPPLLIS